MAAVFAERGDTVLVMRGEDGLDEFTTAAPTRVWVARGGDRRETVLDAADLGCRRPARAALRGGDAAYNADVARALLAGERGPVRDAVLVNAAAALAAYDGLRRTAAGGGGGRDGRGRPRRSTAARPPTCWTAGSPSAATPPKPPNPHPPITFARRLARDRRWHGVSGRGRARR